MNNMTKMEDLFNSDDDEEDATCTKLPGLESNFTEVTHSLNINRRQSAKVPRNAPFTEVAASKVEQIEQPPYMTLKQPQRTVKIRHSAQILVKEAGPAT